MHDQSLTEPDRIRPEHLMALAYADEAESALVGICERVSRLVELRLGAPFEFRESRGEPDYGRDYYEAWRLSADTAGLGGRWLDWNARNDATHQEANGRSLVFVSALPPTITSALT